VRNIWVDYAKAIGIVLVVYGHVARGVSVSGIPMDDTIFNQVDAAIYSFHMPLFFFLSGLFFVDSFEKRGWRGFALNKLDVIVYPYIVWSVFQGLIEVGLNRWTNNRIDISQVLSLLWVPRAQFWFLYALFYISIFSMASYLFVKNRYLILLLSIVLYFYGLIYPSILPLSYICNFSVYFFIGVFFPKKGFPGNFHAGALAGLGLLLFASTQFVLYASPELFVDNRLYSLLLALVAIGFVVSSCVWLSRWNMKKLALIGSASMVIYLMHVLIGGGTRILLSSVGVENVYAHLMLGCLFGLLVPVFMIKNASRFSVSFLFVNPVSFEKKYLPRLA